MNINYYKSKKKIPSWLKWLFTIIIIILLISVTFGLIMYNTIQKDKTKGYSQTEKDVLNNTDIVSIDKITHFFGEKEYHIAFGQDSDNNGEIAFVEQNENNEQILTFDSKEMISEQKIQSLWDKDCKDCKLIKITPAMVDKEPLWEIAYENHEEHYIINYLSMYDGSSYEQYHFKPTFK